MYSDVLQVVLEVQQEKIQRLVVNISIYRAKIIEFQP